MIKETVRVPLSGLPMLLLWLLVIAASIFTRVVMRKAPILVVLASLVLLGVCICLGGLFTVQPNQGMVLNLFGRYVGTVKQPGLYWVNPFIAKKPISLRVRNFRNQTVEGQRPGWESHRDRSRRCLESRG